jgi:hypothetical protein
MLTDGMNDQQQEWSATYSLGFESLILLRKTIMVFRVRATMSIVLRHRTLSFMPQNFSRTHRHWQTHARLELVSLTYNKIKAWEKTLMLLKYVSRSATGVVTG